MAGKMLGTKIKSNKYIRNPRVKCWMLGRINNEGQIECLADSPGCVTWSPLYGRLWDEKESAFYYLKQCKGFKSYNNEKIFIIRVNSKNCPIIVDFLNPAYRAKHGNVNFQIK